LLRKQNVSGIHFFCFPEKKLKENLHPQEIVRALAMQKGDNAFSFAVSFPQRTKPSGPTNDH